MLLYLLSSYSLASLLIPISFLLPLIRPTQPRLNSPDLRARPARPGAGLRCGCHFETQCPERSRGHRGQGGSEHARRVLPGEVKRRKWMEMVVAELRWWEMGPERWEIYTCSIVPKRRIRFFFQQVLRNLFPQVRFK